MQPFSLRGWFSGTAPGLANRASAIMEHCSGFMVYVARYELWRVLQRLPFTAVAMFLMRGFVTANIGPARSESSCVLLRLWLVYVIHTIPSFLNGHTKQRRKKLSTRGFVKHSARSTPVTNPMNQLVSFIFILLFMQF